jgi:hypothetical protein
VPQTETPTPEDQMALHVQLLADVAARQAAERELADMGITASPADIESWLSYTPRQRRHAAYAWALMQAGYL